MKKRLLEKDKTLLKGKTKVSQKGKKGMKELVYEVVYEDGQPISKILLEENIITKAKNKIIKKGTKEKEKTESKKKSTSKNSLGKKITVSATAYSGDGITATGTVPRWGTIAVDPTIIPYGTKVYIPQFDEYFIAEDCGGGIKGNKIDIFMNSESQCDNWGKRSIDIYIVE